MAEAFILEQIELKLQMVDGEVDRAEVKSLIKRWTRQMSAVVKIGRQAISNLDVHASARYNVQLLV